jgi:hypothetical protein
VALSGDSLEARWDRLERVNAHPSGGHDVPCNKRRS